MLEPQNAEGTFYSQLELWILHAYAKGNCIGTHQYMGEHYDADFRIRYAAIILRDRSL